MISSSVKALTRALSAQSAPVTKKRLYCNTRDMIFYTVLAYNPDEFARSVDLLLMRIIIIIDTRYKNIFSNRLRKKSVGR